MSENGKHVPKIQILIEHGELSDVRVPVGMELEIEAIQVDPKNRNYSEMCGRAREIYEDGSMRSVSFKND